MAPLEYMNAPRLEELYLAQNKISEVHGINQLTSLRILELGSNRIKSIKNIENLVNLQELWLGRNRITEIAGLGLLKNLKRLSLQSNRITSLRGLESCTTLEELYISHNGITSIEVSVVAVAFLLERCFNTILIKCSFLCRGWNHFQTFES